MAGDFAVWKFAPQAAPPLSSRLVPDGVAVDTAGNVYIDDTGNDAMKKYSP